MACLVYQLICSNVSKQSSEAFTVYQRRERERERESSIPHYEGLSLHVTDRQNGAIVTFHALGMSVLFDRVMDVKRGFAQAVSK